MLVEISQEVGYGNKSLVFSLKVDVSSATALIGPNLSGKSVLLQCIYSRARRRVGRMAVASLRCETEREDYTAVYVDSYRVVAQLYEAAVEEVIARLRDFASQLERHRDEEVQRIGSLVAKEAVRLERVLRNLDILLGLKRWVDDMLVCEAVDEFLELYRLFEEARGRAAAKIEELFEDFFPLFLSATEQGFVWRDLRFGAGGRGLTQLSTGFSPALVALYAIYAYATPEETYLLVEEPESHAQPVATYFLGVFLRRLARRSGGRLNVVAATHSLDFLKGFWEENFTKTYVLKRREAEGKIELYVDREWGGEAYVPGFTDPTVYALLNIR